ncbi:uncharacterized protein J3D65DRAFT_407005 [Phyllosticta citribraziliensis]|uniref:Uncharacterized protein n=1 Tax=Phyllosticta citribraziliensis TaxID=989973 RepID=A0ABR1LLX0_9PEZI
MEKDRPLVECRPGCGLEHTIQVDSCEVAFYKVSAHNQLRYERAVALPRSNADRCRWEGDNGEISQDEQVGSCGGPMRAAVMDSFMVACPSLKALALDRRNHRVQSREGQGDAQQSLGKLNHPRQKPHESAALHLMRQVVRRVHNVLACIAVLRCYQRGLHTGGRTRILLQTLVEILRSGYPAAARNRQDKLIFNAKMDTWRRSSYDSTTAGY